MGEGLSDVLPWAVGVAVSTTATTTVVLLLMTSRPRQNAMSMVLGWVVSLAVVSLLALVTVVVLHVTRPSETTTRASLLRIFLGGLLLALAELQRRRFRRRVNRRRRGQPPKWARAMDTMTPRRALVLGAAVGDLKNLTLAVAAMTALAEADIHGVRMVGAMTAFVVLGSAGVLVPLGVYFAKGDQAEETMRRWRDWLLANSVPVMVIVAMILGAALIVLGAAELVG